MSLLGRAPPSVAGRQQYPPCPVSPSPSQGQARLNSKRETAPERAVLAGRGGAAPGGGEGSTALISINFIPMCRDLQAH